MKWILASEYAKKVGVSRQRVYYLAKIGRLKTRKGKREVEVLEVLDEYGLAGLAENTTKNK